ncbi:hypothetical protein APUTEX25_000648, partial [Auxenochlorella protothecoides]
GFWSVQVPSEGRSEAEKAAKKAAKAAAKAQKEAEKAAKAASRGQKQASVTEADPNDPLASQYGDVELVQSQTISGNVWTKVEKLDPSIEGTTVLVRARVQTVRGKGKSAFLVLRQELATVQAVLFVDDNFVSKGMVELKVTAIRCVARAGPLPFEIADAARGAEAISKATEAGEQVVTVLQDTRLDNRIIDLRTPANHSIFRVQSAVTQLFREFLLKEDFVEIHTPKLLGGASEGGASVFKLDYMGQPACLAQSPQFYKQMAICSDLPRVFEVGPVFRAENSYTHRHLCEFTGLDMEMTINESYHEVLDVVDRLFHTMFEVDPFGDLNTELERVLGKIVAEKYNTDFYILHRYPSAIRPFYTMPCKDDERYSCSYDIFIRGEEIISGAQRIHDPSLLERRAKECGIPVETIQAYVDSFKYGAWPHGGIGVGMERVVMLFCGLDNVRKTSMFPRDPKRLAP